MSRKPTYKELEQRVRELEEAILQHANAGGAQIGDVGKTGEKEPEQTSLESEERYRRIVELSFEGIAVQRADKLVSINPAGAKLLGFDSPEPVIGRSLLDFFHPDHREEMGRRFTDLMEGKAGTDQFEGKLIRVDGAEMDIELAATAISYEGEPAELAVFRDISKRGQKVEALTASETRLKSMLNAIGDPLCMMDKDMEIIWANETAQRIFGKNITGRKCHGTYLGRKEPCDPEQCPVRMTFQDGELHEHETEVIDKEGNTLHFHCIATVALNDNEGNPVAVIETSRDISEQKRLQEDLIESRKLLGNILAASGVGIAHAKDRKIVWANEAMARMFGFTREEDYSGKDTSILYASGEEYARIGRLTYETSPGGILETDARFRRQDDGSEFYGQIKVNIMDPSNPREGIIVNIIDITERKKAEDALRKSEERFRSFLNNLGDIAYETDTSGNITYTNRMAEKVSGISREELIGKPFLPLFTEESRKTAVRVYEETLSGGSPEYELTLTNGKICHFKTDPLRNEHGKIIGVFGIARDITERKGIENALRESEEKLRSVINHAPVILWAVDHRGIFTFSEGRGLNSLGLKPGEVVGRSIFEVYADEPEVCVDARKALAGETFSSLRRVKDFVFDTRYVSFTKEKGTLIGAIGVATDVTEQKRLEDQLQQARKMEAVGTLAGGIAHDFNNSLGAILGYAEMAMLEIPEESRTRYFLSNIYQAGERAKDLVKQILTFSRRTEQEFHSLHMSTLVKETLKFLRSTLPSTIEIHQRIQTDRDVIFGDVRPRSIRL